MKKLVAFLLFMCSMYSVEVRAQVTEIPVEVVVDKLSYSKIKGMLTRTTEAVYKIYRSEIDPENYLADKGCLILISKDVEKTQVLADDPTLVAFQKMKPFFISSTAESFKILMESFEDDKGEQCNYDKGDDSYSISSVVINLSELNPGVFSAPITLAGKDGKMSAVIRVRYGIPTPAPIVHKESLPINHATQTVELHSMVDLNNKKNLNFAWEYLIEGSSEWKVLGKTISESVVFFPIRDVFKTPIKTNRSVRFRMKAVSPEISSEYVEYATRFTPEIPQFTPAEIQITQSCFNAPTASVNINDLKGVADKFSYYIISGKTLSDQQYPDVISPASKIKWGILDNGAPFKVEGLGEGDYTVVVHNAGMEVGPHYFSHAFSVVKYPSLVIKSSGTKEATCSTTPDGQILMEVEGGNPSRFVFLITPAMGKQQQFGRSVIFSELLPGSYSVVVKDACNQLVTADLEVPKKNMQLRGKLSVVSEPVNEISNGSIQVALAGGMGKYKYVVSRNNLVVNEKEANADIFTIDKLGKGSYQLKVIDLSAALCPGWDTTFSLQVKTLVLDTVASVKLADLKTDTAQAVVKKEWSTLVTDPSLTKVAARTAVYENSSPDKNIVSFASYAKTLQGLKKYYILIEKSKYEMKVFNALDNTLIVTYPVVFGSADQGDKLYEGDRRTPEGEFRIVDKRVHEKWIRFLQLDYPNEESMAKFNERKDKGEIPKDAKIGNEIGIHGIVPSEQPSIDRMENWTMGCVSTKNNYIEELFTFIPIGTKVVIKK